MESTTLESMLNHDFLFSGPSVRMQKKERKQLSGIDLLEDVLLDLDPEFRTQQMVDIFEIVRRHLEVEFEG
jgi:hypothetical protein